VTAKFFVIVLNWNGLHDTLGCLESLTRLTQPDVHIVVVSASDVASDFETVMARLRSRFGAGAMPRTVNMITGPSRSADIEQTLILGAHGPRKLHVIVVGEP